VEIFCRFAKSRQTVTTDLDRLVSILNHLLLNAIKFTSKGSIVIGYDMPVNQCVHIWVRDTGKGIAPEFRDRIFERFFKVDEYVPGAGLGLSICKTMAYSIGGNIGVDSVLGEGSNFWVEIPIE
jgi:signal transduction histidine kinase